MNKELKQEYEELCEKIKDIELEAYETSSESEESIFNSHAARYRTLLQIVERKLKDPNYGSIAPIVLEQINLTRQISRELKDTRIEMELNKIEMGAGKISDHYSDHIRVLEQLLIQLQP